MATVLQLRPPKLGCESLAMCVQAIGDARRVMRTTSLAEPGASNAELASPVLVAVVAVVAVTGVSTSLLKTFCRRYQKKSYCPRKQTCGRLFCISWRPGRA